MAWAKDTAAGLGLVVFVTFSFYVASALQAFLTAA